MPDGGCYSFVMVKAFRAGWVKSELAIPLGMLAMGLVEALVLAGDAPIWPQVPLTFAWTLPLIWRRRWPVPVLGLVIVCGPAIGLFNEQGGVSSFVLSAMLAAYTVGRELDAPSTWWGPALTIGFNWVISVVIGSTLSDYVFLALFYGGAWAVGYAMRRRDQQIGQLVKQAEELERSYEERKRKAVDQERARIARELHDIVTHSISVISIQAQVVRRRLPVKGGPDEIALRSIESMARQAMVDMRRLLQVLRAEGSTPELNPQPSLDQLPVLVGEARDTGIDVEVTVEGDPVPLESGLGLTAYRVIQEALTNVRKHSDSRKALIALRYRCDQLEISVDDNGPKRRPPSSGELDGRGGLGLAGMGERVKLYNGSLHAEPKPDGGFTVRVVLPLAPVETVAT